MCAPTRRRQQRDGRAEVPTRRKSGEAADRGDEQGVPRPRVTQEDDHGERRGRDGGGEHEAESRTAGPAGRAGRSPGPPAAGSAGTPCRAPAASPWESVAIETTRKSPPRTPCTPRSAGTRPAARAGADPPRLAAARRTSRSAAASSRSVATAAAWGGGCCWAGGRSPWWRPRWRRCRSCPGGSASSLFRVGSGGRGGACCSWVGEDARGCAMSICFSRRWGWWRRGGWWSPPSMPISGGLSCASTSSGAPRSRARSAPRRRCAVHDTTRRPGGIWTSSSTRPTWSRGCRGCAAPSTACARSRCRGRGRGRGSRCCSRRWSWRWSPRCRSGAGGLVGEHDTRIWRIVHHYVERRARAWTSPTSAGWASMRPASGAARTTCRCSPTSTAARRSSPRRAATPTPTGVRADLAAHGGRAEQIVEVCQDMSEAFLSGAGASPGRGDHLRPLPRQGAADQGRR